MRSQENQFIHLDSVIGWRTAKRERLYEDDKGLSLHKVPGADKPLVDEEGTFGGLDYPTGLAVDKDRNVYISDTNHHTIKKYDFYKKEFIILSCLGREGSLPRQLKSPRGLAISGRNDLFVADTGNHRIQIFSLKGLILRDIWGSVDSLGNPVKGSGGGQFYEPTDVAVDNRENVYVVDKGNNRIQKFSKRGQFILKFGEMGEDEGKFLSPVHIAVDKKDRLYVVDEKKNYVQVFDSEGKYITKIEGPEEEAESFRPLAIAIDREGNVYIGEGSGKKIYRFSYEGREEEGIFYRGHSIGFEGETSYLMIDDDGNLYASLEDLGVVTAFIPEEYRYEKKGILISDALDSEIYKCQWHRILIEADIPDGTSIEVQTYTSESKKDINEIEKLPDNMRATRNIENLSPSSWTSSQVNSKDFLVLNPPGRFLWLKIIFKGNIKTTPVLKNIRIYYPRDSYLQYLPRVYQEDETSRAFLERFLSIFKTIISGFEDKVTHIARYFNPESTPEEFLSWLGSWLALVLDEKWPENKKRKLIKRAPELYKKRGTVEGLKEYIEIYTGLKSHIQILEQYKLRRWIFLDKSILGCDSALWGKGIVGRLQLDEYSRICSFKLVSTGDPMIDPFHQYAHRFSVVVPSSFCEGGAKERAIRQIVDVEKPAHTQYKICKVEPKFRVGLQSTISVDTIIGIYPVTVLGLRSALGIDSVLGETPAEKEQPTLRVGRKSRIGVDTVID